MMVKKPTKKRIIEKALELIGKFGYNNVSSRQIAREVGISVSTLFYHFPEGLLDILLHSYDLFEDELQIKIDDTELFNQYKAIILKYSQLEILKEAGILTSKNTTLYWEPDSWLLFFQTELLFLQMGT